MTLDTEGVREILRTVTAAKGTRCFFDVHVHPFDVVVEDLGYRPDPTQSGVFGLGAAPYSPMGLGPVRIGAPVAPETLTRGGLLLLQRRMYRHTGPAVLGHQMALAGIDRALLLPVAPLTGDGEAQMDTLGAIFGADSRFACATSVPNSVANAGIGEFVAAEVRRRGVAAIKLHPPITGVDLGSAAGRERTEAILDACASHRLPLVVHGGVSRFARDPQAASYGSIDRLRDIRWGAGRAPVVIAHAASYGCSLREIEQEVLPDLARMLSTHDNLLVDVAALEHDALVLVLQRVDRDRVLFGSDALYDPSWSMMAKLVSALRTCGSDVEDAIAAIASDNPSRTVFAGDGRAV
jgi:predicted TIM-barrel fold metal-dependent hydrolase